MKAGGIPVPDTAERWEQAMKALKVCTRWLTLSRKSTGTYHLQTVHTRCLIALQLLSLVLEMRSSSGVGKAVLLPGP